MPFIGNIGPGELIIILIIILVIFGPGRLPEIGQAVGKGIREFRKAATDVSEATRLDAPPAAPTPSPPPAAPTDMTPVSQPPTAPSTPADESHDGASQPTA